MYGSTMKPELFDSAYAPDWHQQIKTLSEMTLPEAWTFRQAPTEKMSRPLYLLERYILSVFRYQVISAQNALTSELADEFFHIRSGYACFNTGLVTKHFKPIYCYFERNKYGYQQYWRMSGFYDDASFQMRKISSLPKKPFFKLQTEHWCFSPSIPIRVNVEHILQTPGNLERIPEEVREFRNLSMLLNAGVEVARRTSEVMPSMVVPQVYQGHIQYLLPIGMTDPDKTDLAMTISPMGDYYLASTCLTPHMAYANARLLARPSAPWLTELVA